MRVTSAIFVAALIKQAQMEGKFASLMRKGFESSGAIYVSVIARDGTLALYGPASQADYGDQETGRRFEKLEPSTQNELQSYMQGILRFDSDIWHLEIEADDLLPPTGVDLIDEPKVPDPRFKPNLF
jgi:hypothetical protein